MSTPPPPHDDTSDNSPHYLRTVTELAERREVVAENAIYSENGIKLIDKGTRIGARMYEGLLQHKLREPIDRHLSVADPVNVASLLAQAGQLLQNAFLPRLLAQTLGGTARLLAPLKALSLTPRIAFKLTVMREQMPSLFTHSLEVMLTAQYLALASHMPDQDCNRLAAAALLHDLGVLHMDPVWRDPSRKVTGAERRHLVAHPVTAMLVARDARIYGAAVETAILEHHERMDGTGYPRGLEGAAISPLGQVLLMAEVVAAFAEKYADEAFRQLSLVLRLNHRKFPKALTAHILARLTTTGAGADGQATPDARQLQALVRRLSDAFDQWDAAKAQSGLADAAKLPPGPMAFVQERLRLLRHALIETGMDSGAVEHLRGDDAGMAELGFVVREALWQLTSIVNGCERRWATELREGGDPPSQAAARWCRWVRSLEIDFKAT